jgi:mannose-6-phosphate isomerase-like protein (cupin superfamily)
MTLMKSCVALSTAVACALLSTAMAAEQPAPAPGTPGVFVDHAAIAAELAKSVAAAKNPAVAPISLTDQYLINRVRRTKTAPPAAHPGWTELHLVLDGSATFVTGGQITTKNGASVITGGVTQKVQKGDAVIVPANTPHWYQQIDGEINVVEVRFIAPTTKESAR